MQFEPYRRVAFRGGVLRVLLRAVAVPHRAVQPEDAFYASYGPNAACRDQGVPVASLWANIPHYIAGTENPRAALTLSQRVAEFLHARVDLAELEEAAEQFDQNLAEVVAKNAEIAAYVKKLEEKDPDEDEPALSPRKELPPGSDVVAEIEQFLRQQRPGEPTA